VHAEFTRQLLQPISLGTISHDGIMCIGNGLQNARQCPEEHIVSFAELKPTHRQHDTTAAPTKFCTDLRRGTRGNESPSIYARI